VAVSVRSAAGGATPVSVIVVLFSTVTAEMGTALPSAAVMVTGVTGQAAVALPSVVNPVPVMVTLS